ncbi:hypothetical protein GGI25_003780 [Coemansia spiralis]|uniref:Uncharacterized protein n=2 Tax=Coemansia TaxID=4863 RepID=A0A9W8KXQ2_9FUNG|nr:hypothetical protein BX070DRAFT_72823 [Coemansia spiralis]KAJ1994381.1 hypothetical protein EDC05_001580 [Coemansia umbellata]KAJ2624310.1 hypothetical protein GGI26_001666 [Coemansia sp. RSA 1358]KAJ2675943.1 hypothetical protein GGI25_003780 [Coemansia spiralis]
MEQQLSPSEWVPLFETFFKNTELNQSLRTLKIETVTFPCISLNFLSIHLRCLADGIQHLLEKHAHEKFSMQGADSTSKRADESNAQDVVQSICGKEGTAQNIDGFISKQRKEIDDNNRQEFLISETGRDSTCARVDANGASKGIQIQLSAVSNNNNNNSNSSSALERSTTLNECLSHKQHGLLSESASLPLSGLDERVDNLCDHLNVRFVPDVKSIYSRVSALEDRIMTLEKEFPPWSAEHFNQPGRRYLQSPPVTIYRVLPPPLSPSSDTIHVSPGLQQSPSTAGKQIKQLAQRKTSVKSKTKSAGALDSRLASIQKRKKAGSTPIKSPLDKTGKPIFRSCGRGVNSSLTRSVLAQLQSRKPQTPAPTQTVQQQPSSGSGSSNANPN